MVFTWNYKKKNKKIQHNFSVVVVVLVSTILQQFPPGMITRTSHCLSISKEYFQPTWPLDTPKKVHVLTTSLSKLYNNYYSTNSVGTVPGKRLPWFPSSSSNFPGTRTNADRREFYSARRFLQPRHHPTEIIEPEKPVVNSSLHLAIVV